MKRILLRADDLGYSRGVNYGIFDTVAKGLVNNVGVMINMPFAEHGINLLQMQNIDLGCHTNITNGKPITDPKLIPTLVDQNGYFKRSKVYRENMLQGKSDFVDFSEAVTEVTAQYKRFVKLIGKKPDYFEGHAVFSPNFIKAMKYVAKKFELNYLDFPLHGETVKFKQHTKFKFMIGGYKNGKNDLSYDPLSMLQNCIEHSEDEEIPMIVSHSGYLDQYLLDHSSLTFSRPKEAAAWMSKEANGLVSKNHVVLLRYSQCE